MSERAASEDGSAAGELHRDGPIGIVISGAAARGPFEAGVLAELLPRLFRRKSLREALMVGTSAGAVNAALWAFFADGERSLDEVGKRVCDFWIAFDQPNVFRFRLRSVLQPGAVNGLFDTTPLRRHAPRKLGVPNLQTALSQGGVGTLAAVATSCGEHAYEGRSAVFFEGHAPTPPPDDTSAVDYVRVAGITLEHVLASAAIPVLFPAFEVTEPPSARGYYMDGGVRLNTPIKVALELGASRIAVVSSHATEYPSRVNEAHRQPDLVDMAAQSLHTILAHSMIEDLRQLKRSNARALAAASAPSGEAARPGPHEPIELIEAAPKLGQLGWLAEGTLRSPPNTLRERRIRLAYKLFRYGLLGLGSGSGNDELLSYVLFDPDFARAQIALGREEGKRAAERGWSLGG